MEPGWVEVVFLMFDPLRQERPPTEPPPCGPREEITFTKNDFGDYTSEDQQDRISDSLWLTRQDSLGLYNAALETAFDQEAYVNSSPEGVFWAFGDISDYASLDYVSWSSLTEETPSGELVGRPLVVYFMDDNLYFQLTFQSWSDDADGGGFSYTRSSARAKGVLVDSIFNMIEPGRLVAVWFDSPVGETFANGAKLFDLFFELVGDPGESSEIALVSDPVDYRVGTASRKPVLERSTSGEVQIANLRYLGGEVRYLDQENHLISSVKVKLTQDGEPGREQITSGSGAYKASVNPEKETTIEAEALGTVSEGSVDLLDITKVGQHVALLSPFSLPQEWVAADVNGDLAVDGVDISAMLKVALGETNVFHQLDHDLNISVPSNWHFVNPAFLSTPAESALFNLSEYGQLVIPAGLEADKDDAHLAAIRLGDVDGSLADEVGPYSARAATRASLALSNTLEFGGMALNEEGELEVAVHGRFEDGIMGVQFDLNWDAATLQLEGLSAPQLSGFDERRHFSLREGEGTLLWFEPRFGSAAIDGESPVVSLRFSLVEGATQGTMIHLSKPKIVHGSGQGGTIEMTSVYVSEEALGLEIASTLPEGTQRVTEFTTPGPVKSFAFSSEGVSLDFATTPGCRM